VAEQSLVDYTDHSCLVASHTADCCRTISSTIYLYPILRASLIGGDADYCMLSGIVQFGVQCFFNLQACCPKFFWATRHSDQIPFVDTVGVDLGKETAPTPRCGKSCACPTASGDCSYYPPCPEKNRKKWLTLFSIC